MNERIKTNATNNGELSTADRVCEVLEEIGWRYEREGDKVQVAFKTADETKTYLITCVTDILNDKLFVSTSLGIKTKCASEILKLFNYINTHKIYYGRFVVVENGSIWYDYTVDIKPDVITKERISRVFSIAENCAEHFCNPIFDVAIGAKSADQVIESIK